MSELRSACEQMLADAEAALRAARKYVAAHEEWERVFNADEPTPRKLAAAELAADDALREAEVELDAVSVESLAMNVTGLVARVRELEAVKLAYEQTPKQWSTAQAPTLESVAATYRGITAQQENEKLRAAIRAAGFAVMQTSGAWSIHDVSERAKQLEADDLKRVNRICDLEIENAKLREALKPFAAVPTHPMASDDMQAALAVPGRHHDMLPAGVFRRAAELLATTTATEGK